jgi:hypothetical protein
MGNVTDLERLAGLLDDDELLVPNLRGALAQEAEPWEALLAGLDDAGVLASLEADDTGMELADALAQLPRVFRLQLDLGDVTDTDDLDDAIAAADAVLVGRGFRLVQLPDPDDVDVRALVVVDAGNVAEILRLSTELQHPAVVFG